MDDMENKIYKCSFCDKPESPSRRLIGNPEGNSFICEECVALCKDLIGGKTKKVDKELKLLAPQEIKEKLDEYIIGQDEAKKALAVAVYNHYKRINYNVIHAHDHMGKPDEIELEKSNILMVGPTGCGKTLLAKTLASILNVPFASCDATTLTEAGYVGDDVENILLKLIQNANYDISQAERGIIYVDEIDKLAKKSQNVSITRDVSGEGVQQALLKIVESTVASVPPQGGRKHPQQEMIQIDTTNILFICGGAFVGLDKIVEGRLNSSSLGFNADIKTKVEKEKINILKQVQPGDLIKFGIIPELVGRLPVFVSLDDLDEEAFVKILTEPKNALVKQYVKLFNMDNIELCITPEATKAVAKKAKELKTGARGLRAIIEEAMQDVMFFAPGNNVKKIIITKEVIENKAKPEVVYCEKKEETA